MAHPSSPLFLLPLLLLLRPTTQSVTSPGACPLHAPESQLYVRPGFVTLAYIAQVRTSRGGYCRGSLFGTEGALAPDVFAFAVEKVNERDNLLPNVTLGLLVMDGCMDSDVTLANVWRLMGSGCSRRRGGDGEGAGVGTTTTETPRVDTTSETTGVPIKTATIEEITDVIGVVGPLSSGQAITVSGSLGIHHIPHLGILSTSDELSDKSR